MQDIEYCQIEKKAFSDKIYGQHFQLTGSNIWNTHTQYQVYCQVVDRFGVDVAILIYPSRHVVPIPVPVKYLKFKGYKHDKGKALSFYSHRLKCIKCGNNPLEKYNELLICEQPDHSFSIRIAKIKNEYTVWQAKLESSNLVGIFDAATSKTSISIEDKLSIVIDEKNYDDVEKYLITYLRNKAFW